MNDLTEARHNLNEAIEAYCKGRYDARSRDEALAALFVEQPCVLNTAGYHNCAAANAASFVNTGKGDFLAYCETWAKGRKTQTPARAVLFDILDDLVAVNLSGAKLLADADAYFSAAYLIERAPVSLAAE